MKAKATCKRLLSLLLAMVMLVGALPLSSLAATTDKTISTAKTASLSSDATISHTHENVAAVSADKTADLTAIESHSTNAQTKQTPVTIGSVTVKEGATFSKDWNLTTYLTCECGRTRSDTFVMQGIDQIEYTVSPEGAVTDIDMTIKSSGYDSTKFYLHGKGAVPGEATVTVSFTCEWGLAGSGYYFDCYYCNARYFPEESDLPGNATVVFPITITSEETQYELHYDANGGEGKPAAQTAKSTADSHVFTASTTEPTREGYAFKGWADTRTATTAGYLAGDPVTVTKDQPVKTIYAVWEQVAFDCTLNYMNAAGTTPVQTAVLHLRDLPHAHNLLTTYPESATDVPAGYTFKGWTLTQGSEETVTSVTFETGKTEITVYPVWEIIPTYTYTLTYDANGEGVTGLPEVVTVNDVTDESHDFTLSTDVLSRDGYTFKGWAASADSTTPITTVTATSTNPDVTVYAIWEKATTDCEVNYMNASGNRFASQTVKGVTLPYTFTLRTDYTSDIPEGHTFVGWTLTRDSDETVTSVTFETGKTTINVYPVFEKNAVTEYTVTFDAVGGTPVPEVQSVQDGMTATEPEAPAKPGYLFLGWFNGDAPYDFTTPVTGDLTLTAKYEKLQTVQLVIYRNGNTEKAYKTVALDPMRKGDTLDVSTLNISDYYTGNYKFEGWYTDSGWSAYKKGNPNNTIAAPVVINGWTNIICMVTDYENVIVKASVNGGEAETIFAGKALRGTNLLAYLNENVDTEKTGYTADLWYKGDAPKYKFGESDTVNGWTNVLVKYTANEYTLNFDANGGEVDPASKTVTYDAAVGELPVPTKTGYEFAGWFVDETQYTAETVYTVDGDTTLTAHWTAEAYNLTLDFGGHKETITRYVSMDAPIGELPGMETTYSTPRDSGGVSYTYFVGGWVDEDGNTVTAETIFTYAKDVTLTATWIPMPISGGQEADEMFTIQCDTDAAHKWVHNKSDVKYVAGSLRFEDGVWKATVEFNKLSNANMTQTCKNHFGNHKHYHLDGSALNTTKKYQFTVYFDPAQEGVHYDDSPYVGQWKPVDGADAEANTIHVKCYAAPAAPTTDKIKTTLSGKLLWVRDKNNTGNSMKVTTGKASKTVINFATIADTLQIGEPYQENGNFYVKVKIADLTPYLDAFKAQYGENYEIVWDQNHNTADDFEYVLKYKASTGIIDYKQDGSGWSLDTTATTYKDNSEKLNGKILYVMDCYKVTYTDGAKGAVFADEVYEIALADKGYRTPAFRGSLDRTGYTFRGWNPEIAEFVNASATYTATWEANRYTIFLDPNGGTCSKDHIDVTYGSKLTNLPTPTRTGYKFSGWVDANGKKYSTYSTYDVAGNLYLTATWTAYTYQAKFYQNNPANTLIKATITYDQPYGDAIPEMEALPGFSSDGWYLMSGNSFTDTEITKDTVVTTTSNPTIRVRRAILDPVVEITATSSKFFGKGYEDVDGERVCTYIYISADPTQEITLTANVTKYDNLAYTYQWYKDGEAIEGATGETYTYARTVQNSGVYSVKVTATNTATKVITTNTSAEGTASQDIRVEKVRNALMYYANNGTTNSRGFYSYEKTVTVTENPSFTKTGYEFASWNTLEDGTGTTYLPGSSFTFEADDGNGNQSAKLYAQWNPAEYTLTFDAAGGEVDPATKTVTYDAPVGELPVPTKPGYGFAGWFVGDTQYTAETVYTVAGDTTLTAHWTPNSYTLTLDFGGHKDNTTKPVTTDSPIGELPGTETKYSEKHDGGVTTFYFVGGWVDGEGNPVTAETIFNYAGDTTIYAQWIPVPLTSGGPVAAEIYTIQCTTHEDHSWICNSAQMKVDADSLKLVDGVWTCTATFSRLNLVNISTTQKEHFGGFKHYDLDGNALVEGRQKVTVTLFYNTEAEGENKYIGKYKGEWQPVDGAANWVYQVKCYDKPAMPVAEKLTLSNLIKLIDTDNSKNYLKPTSKDFKNYLDAIHIGEEMTEDNKNFYVTLTLDLAPFIEAFQAKYGTDYVLDEKNEYGPETVSFVLSYPKSTKAYGNDYAQDGSGWKIDASSYKNTTEKNNGKPIYLHNAYYVTYTDGAKGAVFADQVYKIALADKGCYTPSFVGSYTRAGYSFRGWNPVVAQTVTESATYTAQWEANRYVIFLNPNGGTCSKDHIDVTYGTKLSNLPTPTRTGYTFNGWYDADGNKYSTLTTYSVEGNITLTARWTAKTYTAKFYQNNPANTYTSAKITYDQPYGDVIPEMEALPGFSSDGWYLMSGNKFTDTEITSDLVVATTTNPTIRVRRAILEPVVELTAETNKYFASGYEDVDGVWTLTHIYVAADPEQEITLTANVTKYDNIAYTYQWYKDGEAIEGATGETYTYARTVQNSGVYSVKVTATKTATKVVTTNTSAETTVSQDIRVKPLSNTVIYKPNSDAITSGSKNAYSYDATVSIDEKPWHWNPTGYVFTGWNTKEDGTGDAYQPGDTYTFTDYDGNVSLSLTLFAQWKPAEYTVSFDANGGAAVEPITVTYTGKYDGVPKTSPLIGFNSGKAWNLVDENGNVTDTKITKSSTVETARDHTLFMVRSLATPSVTIKCDKVGAYYDGTPATLEAVIPENVKNDELLTYTYQWFKNGEAIEGATEQKLVLDGNVVDSGKYTVTVTATLPDDSTVVVEGEKTASATADYTLRINKIANSLYYSANTEDAVENCPSNNFTNGNTISVQTNVPVRVGYTFAGWNTKADGTGDSYKGGDEIALNDETGNGGIRVDLYAQWTANTYTLTLDAGDGKTEKVTVTYGQPIGELPTPTKDGYTFEGWYDADGNKIVSGLIYTALGDTTLTAKWTAKTTNPSTGDNTPVALYVTLMLFSVGALAAVTVCSKKRYFG